MSPKVHESEPAEPSPELIPDPGLGEADRALVTVSVACVRHAPRHASELVTQLLLGTPLTLTQHKAGWYHVTAPDGTQGWMDGIELARMTPTRLQAWTESPLVIVTAHQDFLWEQPDPKTLPVSDVVLGVTLKRLASSGGWIQVELPDGRTGHLQRHSATELGTWKRTLRATPANIERVARSLHGVPYLWGGASTKAVDCSGFTQLVFGLHGIVLPRNACHQSTTGQAVEPGPAFQNLLKGDLLFFAGKGGRKLEDITHVALHLGQRLFIHAAGRVRLDSLDPASPLFSEERLRTFAGARRVLPAA